MFSEHFGVQVEDFGDSPWAGAWEPRPCLVWLLAMRSLTRASISGLEGSGSGLACQTSCFAA